MIIVNAIRGMNVIRNNSFLGALFDVIKIKSNKNSVSISSHGYLSINVLQSVIILTRLRFSSIGDVTFLKEKLRRDNRKLRF